MQAWLLSLAIAATGSAPPPYWDIPADYTLAERTAWRTDPAKAQRARGLLEQGLDQMFDPSARATRAGRGSMEEAAYYGNPHAAALLCSMDSSPALGLAFWLRAHVWCGFALRITPAADGAARARAQANLDFVDRRLGAADRHGADMEERRLYVKVKEKIDEPAPQGVKPVASNAAKDAALGELEAAIDASAKTAGMGPEAKQASGGSPAEDAAAAAAAAASSSDAASHRQEPGPSR